MWFFRFVDIFGWVILGIVIGLPVIVLIVYSILKFVDFEGNPVLGGVTLECHHCHQQTRASHRCCQHCKGELQ